MSLLERRASLNPPLPHSDNLAQSLGAHLGKYWAPWSGFVVALVAAAIGLHTGVARLGERWDYPYDHSWLVLGMTGWLLWRALRRSPVPRVAPSVPGLAALVLMVLFYSLSEVLDISLGMHVSLPAILLALVAAIFGLPVARVAALPFAMLYFTIPVWDLTIPPLQAISTAVVAWLVSWSGLVAYTVGNLITIPSGSFEIAEGCSGMRYFMVSLAITAFIGLSWYERWRTRILLLVVAGLASMASNWFRIYTLILIGDATDMQHYVVAKSHDGYGWLVYVVFLLPVLWFARFLDKREERTLRATQATASQDPAVTATLAAPVSFLVAAGVAAAVLLAPSAIRGGHAAPPEPQDVRVMPFGGSGWLPVAPAHSWEPEFRAPYFSTHESLESADGTQVDLFLARYLSQRPGSKLVSTHNRFSPDWQVTSSGERTITLADDSLVALETVIVRGGERRLVWQWYVVGGKPAHQRVRAKLMEVRSLLRGRRDGAAIALSARCGFNCDTAAEAMDEMVRLAGPRLLALADGAADSPPSP